MDKCSFVGLHRTIAPPKRLVLAGLHQTRAHLWDFIGQVPHQRDRGLYKCSTSGTYGLMPKQSGCPGGRAGGGAPHTDDDDDRVVDVCLSAL